MGREQERFDATYRAIRDEIKRKTAGDGVDKGEILWTCVEGVSAAMDGVFGTSFGLGGGGAKLLYDAIAQGKEPDATANPWFVWNGQDDRPTGYTRQYLKNRSYKGLAGGALALAGAAASGATTVDVAAIAQHANATGSTAAHIFKLKSIAKSYKQTKTVSAWLDTVLLMKYLKAGIRGTALAGSSIPVPAAGAVAGVLAAAAKVGAKLTMTKVCLATSADLHWRAFQELTLTGHLAPKYGDGTGPAMRIIHELFYRRGATRVFGQYDVQRLIREPIGWLAINDKLMLL